MATYMTANGPKTVDQMNQELQAAGWGGSPTPGPGATANAYAQTTGGAVTEMSGQDYGAAAQPPSTSGLPDSYNPSATSTILNNAQARAQQAYYNSMLQYNNDQLAFQKAQEAWKEVVDTAGLTGMFQGQPTQAAMQYYTNTFGQWGTPYQGQYSQSALQNYANTFGAWGTPNTGEQTLAAQKQAQDAAIAQANVTGWYTAPTQNAPVRVDPRAFAQQDPALQQTYLQYNGNDPQVAAAHWAQDAQNAIIQSGQAAGPAAQAQPVQTLEAWKAQQQAAQNYLQLLSQMRGPQNYAQYMNVLGSTPKGMQDLVAAAAGQYIPGSGTTGVAPQGANLQSLYADATGQNLAQQQQQLQAAQGALVAPNQIAPQAWNALSPSQQQMLTSIWENQGYTADDAKNLYKQSLPQYTAGSGIGAGSFRLQ